MIKKSHDAEVPSVYCLKGVLESTYEGTEAVRVSPQRHEF